MRKTSVRGVLLAGSVLLVTVAAPSTAWAVDDGANCAGEFASTALTAEAVTFLATTFTGASEFVLVDAACGENEAADPAADLPG